MLTNAWVDDEAWKKKYVKAMLVHLLIKFQQDPVRILMKLALRHAIAKVMEYLQMILRALAKNCNSTDTCLNQWRPVIVKKNVTYDFSEVQRYLRDITSAVN